VCEITDSLFPRDMDDLSSRVQELPGKVMTSVSGVAEKCSLQWCRLTRPLFTAATRVQGRPIYVWQPRLFQTSGRNRVFSAEWSVPSLDISLLPFGVLRWACFLVCLSAGISQKPNNQKFIKLWCTLPVPKLIPSLAWLGYITYFQFCGWRHVCPKSLGRGRHK